MKLVLILILCYATTYGVSAWFVAYESMQKRFRDVGWEVVSPAVEHSPYRGPIPSESKLWSMGLSARSYQVTQSEMLMGSD